MELKCFERILLAKLILTNTEFHRDKEKIIDVVYQRSMYEHI
jgi:hypothetical protein